MPSPAGAARRWARRQTTSRLCSTASTSSGSASSAGLRAGASRSLSPRGIRSASIEPSWSQRRRPTTPFPWIAAEQRAELERLRELAPHEAQAEIGRCLADFDPTSPFYGDAAWLLAALTSDEPTLRRDGVRARLQELLRDAFAQGPTGLAADIAAHSLQPWGFEPEDVEAKTLLLYGSRDPLAGPRHGRWWKERLPNARVEVAPGEGHLLFIPAWPRILSHLAPGRRRLRAVAA